MRISKRRVVGLMITSLAVAGCAPDAAPTNELIASARQASTDSGSWIPATHMLTKRLAHAALKLTDGRILVIGGTTDPSTTAEFYDVDNDAWTRITVPDTITITSQTTQLCRPALAQSSDGMVVIVANDSILAFDPSTEQWTPDLFQLSGTNCLPKAITLDDGTVLILSDETTGSGVSAYLYDSGKVGPFADLPIPTQGSWARFDAIRLNDGRVLVSGGIQNSSTALYDPSIPNTWSTVGDMYYPRSDHAMALLPNRNVIAVGGRANVDSTTVRADLAEIFDINSKTWSPTTHLISGRSSRLTATQLSSGAVLVIGGSVSSTAELYDLSAESWTAIDSSDDTRYFNHAATLLDNGRILVTGGGLSEETDNAALCDALAFAWEQRTTLPADARAFHSATTLDDGTLLVVGGESISDNTINQSLQDAWLYDPTSDTWTQKQGPSAIHEFHTAVKLDDGRVMIAGGNQSPFAEIFDPTTNTWTSLDSSDYSSSGAISSTLLDGGKVLFLGAFATNGVVQSALFYDPAMNTWSTGPNLPDGIVIGPGHSATLLSDKRVFVTGGFPACPVGSDSALAMNSALLFDPSKNTWTSALPMTHARGFHSATLLPNGRVLVTGGGGEIQTSCTTPIWMSVLATSEIYDPDSNTWSSADSMNEARTEHRAISLPNNRILVVGGRKNSANRILSTAELFDPDDKSWTSTSQLRFGRYGFSLNSLEGGIVAVGGTQPFATNSTTVERFPLAEQGKPCSLDAQCNTGYCVSGICCDTACDSQCYACTVKANSNKVLPDGTCEDISGCAPYACESETGACETTCSSVSECASGYVCDPTGDCIEPVPNASKLDETSCAAGIASSNASPWASLMLVASAYALRRRKAQRKS